MNSAVIRIEALNRENYDTWKLQMQALLTKNDAWSYVSGESRKPEIIEGDTTTLAAFENWKRGDNKAKSDIILSISPSELKLIKGCETSRQVWQKLESIYLSKGPARKATLLKQLTLLRMEDGADVREHVNKFFDTVDKLEEMEIEINKDLLSIMLLYSMPSNFENFRCAIESRDELPTPETLRVKILEEHEARKNESRGASQNALFSAKNLRRQHSKAKSKDERKKSDEPNHGKTEFKYRCHKCHEIGHKAADCDKKKKDTARKVEDISFSTEVVLKTISSKYRKNWCLDSGATSHLTNDKNDFTEIFKPEEGKVSLANNSYTDIIAKGTARIFADVRGENKNLFLNNTLHVPDLRAKLASVAKITDHGFKVIFSKNNAEVVDDHGNVKTIADRVGNLYFIHENDEHVQNVENSSNALQSEQPRKSLAETWHRRLGHLNYKDMYAALKEDRIRGIKIPESNDNIQCEICLKGKMTATPIPKKSVRKSDLLEIIHTDVCGPMRCQSLGKAKYFATFIDDASRWCEVRFLRTKNEVFEAFKEIKAMFENQKGRKIKFLQSDNGTEYINGKFDSYLKNAGITRRLTVPHHPQQNGVSERKNRTLMSTARCLLIQAGLPDYMWAEAVNTANYLRNRCPTSSLDGKTPYEAWHNRIPEASHLKEFGCKVHCLDTRAEKGKLDPRSKEGRFVGYSDTSKAYRVWFSKKGNVQMIRDIRFIEENPLPIEAREDSKLQSPSIDILETLPDTNSRNGDDVNTHQETTEEGEDEPELDPPLAAARRGPGAPKIIRTGQRGRPKKVYNMIPTNEADFISVEEVLLAEIPMDKALNGPSSNEWQEAMADEMASIIKNDTWCLVQRTDEMEVIGSRMVLRNKFGADGRLQRRKARLVAQGFAQRPGVHYSQTFAPVARLSSVKLLMSLAARYNCSVHHLDVATAYLNGELEETIYIRPPKGIEEALEVLVKNCRFEENIRIKAKTMLREIKGSDKVCRLNKALYGLRQAGRAWYSKLNRVLLKMGATPSKCDPCLYRVDKGKIPTLILTYVDDILILSPCLKLMSGIIEGLSNIFEVKNLGEVSFCLGLEFKRQDGEISINQRRYISELLERFGMTDAKPVCTPIETGSSLCKTEGGTSEEDAKLPYRELVGALNYLAMATRPDISFVVSHLGQFNNCFNNAHWTAAKRVLRYLKGTIDLCIRYRPSNEKLKGYVDADWGNNLDDRRSFTGFVFCLNGGPVSWESKKQRTVALSSTEAEFMAMTEAIKETIYFRRIFEEIGLKDLTDITIYNDNMGAIKLAENSVFHNRSKHIDIRFHFIREAVNEGLVRVEHLGTNWMIADILTKGLAGPRLRELIREMGLQAVRSSRGSVRE